MAKSRDKLKKRATKRAVDLGVDFEGRFSTQTLKLSPTFCFIFIAPSTVSERASKGYLYIFLLLLLLARLTCYLLGSHAL